MTINNINGKKYIGQSIGKRKTYLGSGKLLKQAFLKYGKVNFSKEILEYCHSRDEVNVCEKKWIAFYDAVNSPLFYNIAEGGMTNSYQGENHPLFGKKHSIETRRKISESQKGKPGRFNSKHTDLSKNKMREAKIGKPSKCKGIKKV
jgi:group I intron endonuclease